MPLLRPETFLRQGPWSWCSLLWPATAGHLAVSPRPMIIALCRVVRSRLGGRGQLVPCCDGGLPLEYTPLSLDCHRFLPTYWRGGSGHCPCLSAAATFSYPVDQ